MRIVFLLVAVLLGACANSGSGGGAGMVRRASVDSGSYTKVMSIVDVGEGVPTHRIARICKVRGGRPRIMRVVPIQVEPLGSHFDQYHFSCVEG